MATGLDLPRDPVVLTVTGDLERTNADGAAEFDLKMLRSLRVTRFVTSTIWTDGPQVFTGVAVSEILDLLGVTAGVLRLEAIDGYLVDIPVVDIDDDAPIIAYEMNGAVMPVRGKGPLWLVYPYDSDRAYATEQIYSRSIWQLLTIDVQP